MTVSAFMIKMTEALQTNRYLRSSTTDEDYVRLILNNIAEGDGHMLKQRQFHLLSVDDFWKELTYEMEYKGGRSSRSLNQERAAPESKRTSDGCADIVLGMATRSTNMTPILVAEHFEQLDGHIPTNMAEMFRWFRDHHMEEQAARAANEYINILFHAAPTLIQSSLVLWRRDLDRNSTSNHIDRIYDIEDTIRCLFETTPRNSMVLATQIGGGGINGGSGLQSLAGSQRAPDAPCRFCGKLHWQSQCPAHPGDNWLKEWRPKCDICEAAGGFKNVKLVSSKRLSPEELARYSVGRHTTDMHQLALRDFDRKPRRRGKSE